MNNEITCIDSRKRGTVTNFARFTPTMLNSMREDIGLNMTVEQLELLRTYYSKAAHRDPALDELYMLDRLLTLRGLSASPIAKLSTDSSVIADTYADLMAKRGALNISNTEPSLQELQIIPAHYMEMAGKTAPDAAKYLFATGALAKVELLLNGCTDILSAGDAAIGKIKRLNKYTHGSLLALLPRTPDMTTAQFGEKISALLEGPAADCVEAGTVIGELGLIGAVCKFGVGAYLDADALPIKQPCAPEAMCDACHGWVLAIVSHAEFVKFTAEAKELSLPCIIIGNLASGNKLTVKHEKFNNTAFNLNFISTLAPTRQLWLQPQMAEGGTPHSSSSEFVADESMMLATHTAPLDSNAYLTAMTTVLRAVSDCVAHGAAYSDVCISVKLTLPRTMMDTAPEAILGVYRAQIEYYIPDRDSSIVFGNSCKPTITVAAMARIPQLTAAETDSFPKYLYLLSPCHQENGLPRFEELRRMWSYVTAAVRRGHVVAATALTDARVDSDISNLLGDDVTLDNVPPKEQMPVGTSGGILLLSSTLIEGTFIGAITS